MTSSDQKYMAKERRGMRVMLVGYNSKGKPSIEWIPTGKQAYIEWLHKQDQIKKKFGITKWESRSKVTGITPMKNL